MFILVDYKEKQQQIMSTPNHYYQPTINRTLAQFGAQRKEVCSCRRRRCLEKSTFIYNYRVSSSISKPINTKWDWSSNEINIFKPEHQDKKLIYIEKLLLLLLLKVAIQKSKLSMYSSKKKLFDICLRAF